MRGDSGGEPTPVYAGLFHPAAMKLANALCRYRELAQVV
jgi:hypothetical protein